MNTKVALVLLYLLLINQNLKGQRSDIVKFSEDFDESITRLINQNENFSISSKEKDFILTDVVLKTNAVQEKISLFDTTKTNSENIDHILNLTDNLIDNYFLSESSTIAIQKSCRDTSSIETFAIKDYFFWLSNRKKEGYLKIVWTPDWKLEKVELTASQLKVSLSNTQVYIFCKNPSFSIEAIENYHDQYLAELDHSQDNITKEKRWQEFLNKFNCYADWTGKVFSFESSNLNSTWETRLNTLTVKSCEN